MPKVPRDLDPKHLVRALGRLGWVVAREGGRHTILSKGDLDVSVPRHGPLKTGTVSHILRAARVELEEFLRVL